MNKYKYTFGRFGIDENNYLTDIENGTHCLGYIMNRDTGEESENQTELKLPGDINGFSVLIPSGIITLSQGVTESEFGRVYFKYYDDSNIDEKKEFNTLITNALARDKDAAVALVMKLAQPFYTLKEITTTIKNVTYGTLCILITDFINDLSLKFKFAQSGAFSGNSECMHLLGYYYESGRGVEENQKLAFKWYKKAAKNGNQESMNRLVQFYSWNTNACVINPYKSFYWAEKASQNGYIWEWQRVGFAYLYGDATGKNCKKAIYWFKKICNLSKDLRVNCTYKFGEILYCLGYFSFYGISTKKDLHLAFDYFSKSVDEGYYLACEALAYFYENGIIVNQSSTKAKELYELKETYIKNKILKELKRQGDLVISSKSSESPDKFIAVALTRPSYFCYFQESGQNAIWLKELAIKENIKTIEDDILARFIYKHGTERLEKFVDTQISLINSDNKPNDLFDILNVLRNSSIDFDGFIMSYY